MPRWADRQHVSPWLVFFHHIYGIILPINIFQDYFCPTKSHQPVVIFHDPPVIERVNGASPLNGGIQLGKSSNQMPDFPVSLTPEGRKKIIKVWLVSGINGINGSLIKSKMGKFEIEPLKSCIPWEYNLPHQCLIYIYIIHMYMLVYTCSASYSIYTDAYLITYIFVCIYEKKIYMKEINGKEMDIKFLCAKIISFYK